MLRLALHIFPVGQVAAFVGAVLLFPDHLIASLVCLAFAGLMLNFSLHITVHHYVHFRFKSDVLNFCMQILYTLVLGLPFSFYRMQHFNHHRYDNRIGDFTSTWTKKGDQIIPKSWFRYIFFWIIPSNKHILKQAEEEGDLPLVEKRRMQVQMGAILAFYVGMFFVNPWIPLFYAVLFYVGWTLIALTNFGQHLPIHYGDVQTYSYSNRFYNFIFFNNGLHYEHHEHPGLDYNELKDVHKNSLKIPHLPAGIVGKNAIK